MADHEESWAPVVEASRLAGIPSRTAYRWLKAKRLTPRTEGGVTLVEVGALQALAATRQSKSAAASAVVTAGTRAGTGTAVANGTSPNLNEGELAAEAFARFEQGASPIEVVQAMRVTPERVRAWHRDWQALKEPSGPSNAERIATLEELVTDIRKALMNRPEELATIGNHGDRIYEIELKLAALPVPDSRHLECAQCKHRGLVATRIVFTCCGRESNWGFHPKR